MNNTRGKLIASIAVSFTLIGFFSSSSLAFDKEKAKEVFEQGLLAFSEENYPSALALMEKSYALNPASVALRNIAMCQKALYLHTEALKSFKKLLSLDGAKPEFKEEAKAEIKELKKLIASVDITNAPHGAQIFVDALEVGVIPFEMPLKLNPGKHILEVRQKGYQALLKELTLTSGEAVNLDAKLKQIDAILKIDCKNEAAKVFLDNVELGKCPYEGVVQPGTHRVRVSAKGNENFYQDIESQAGELINIIVTLKKINNPLETPKTTSVVTQNIVKNKPSPTIKPSSGKALLIGAIASYTVAATGLGIGFGFMLKGKSDFEAGEMAQSDHNKNDYNEIRDNKLPHDNAMMTLGYAIAGVSATLGTVLLIVRASKGKSQPEHVTFTPNGLLLRF